MEGAKAAAEAKRVVAMASFMVFVMSIYCVMCDGLATSRIYFGLHTQKIHVKVLVEYVYMSCGAVRNDERILPSRISAIFVCHRVMRCVCVIFVGCGWYYEVTFRPIPYFVPVGVKFFNNDVIWDAKLK